MYFDRNMSIALDRRGWSAESFAEAISAPPARMRRLARGATRPRYDEIPNLARALNVPPEALAWEEPARFRARFKSPSPKDSP